MAEALVSSNSYPTNAVEVLRINIKTVIVRFRSGRKRISKRHISKHNVRPLDFCWWPEEVK